MSHHNSEIVERYVQTLQENFDSSLPVLPAAAIIPIANQNVNPQVLSTKIDEEVEEEVVPDDEEEEEVQPIIVQPPHQIIHLNKKYVLGEGSFGCVFTPPFPCKGHSALEYDGLVSKVTTEKEAKNELAISNVLKKFDILERGQEGRLSARYKYCVYALDECHFPIRDAQEIYSYFYPDGKKCNKDLNTYQYLTHMEAANNNVTYAFRAISNEHGVSFWGKDGSTNPGAWTRCFENLVFGLRNLHRNRVYHFDFSSNNALFFGSIDNPRTCKLNDFGLAKMIQSVTVLDYRKNTQERYARCLVSPHYYFPPGINVVFFSMIIDGLLRNEPNYDSKWKKNSDQFFLFHRNQHTKIRKDKLNKELKIAIDFFKNYNRRFFYCMRYFGKNFKEDRDLDYKYFINGNWKNFNKSFQELCQCIDLYGFATILDKYLSLNDTRFPELIEIIVPFCFNAASLTATHVQAIDVIDKMKDLFKGF